MKYIIKLVGVSRAHGTRKAGDFLYSEKHGCLIYKGKELSMETFNETVPQVLENYRDYVFRLPVVQIIHDEPAPLTKADSSSEAQSAPRRRSRAKPKLAPATV